MFELSKLEEIADVLVIHGAVYVKTPEALELVLVKLRQVGYQVDDTRKEAGQGARSNVSVEKMEREGQSLWYAHLPDGVRQGKCDSCHALISTFGIRKHGHKCERCGAVTYYNIVDGSRIRFSFIRRDVSPLDDIVMTAKRWDNEAGYLYFYPGVSDGLILSGQSAQQYFEANHDKWEAVEEDGQPLIKVKYPDPWDYNTSAINVVDVNPHYWNHQIVEVWEGKEYSEFANDFPVPKSISIYETWHWAPLEPSPTLAKRVLIAAGKTDDKSWHRRDDGPSFNPRTFAEMGRFIRHFTTLDADQWDRQSPLFRRDGPGGIDDVVAFCSSPDGGVKMEAVLAKRSTDDRSHPLLRVFSGSFGLGSFIRFLDPDQP